MDPHSRLAVLVMNMPDHITKVSPPPEETAKAAYSIGDLRTQAGRVMKSGARRKLFGGLRRERVGLTSVEVQVWRMVCERGDSKIERTKGLSKWDKIRMERDPEVVCDLLDLKVKYCAKEKEESRCQYKRIKREIANY